MLRSEFRPPLLLLIGGLGYVDRPLLPTLPVLDASGGPQLYAGAFRLFRWLPVPDG
jgi:hypothetical protein